MKRVIARTNKSADRRVKVFLLIGFAISVSILNVFISGGVTRITDKPEFRHYPASKKNDTNRSTYNPKNIFLSTKKRHRMHLCSFKNHNGSPARIIRNEFGYNTTVNALEDDDWDLIFGGYPHCGDGTKKFDWEMATGLNKHLFEKGWGNLKPHQIWFPCMGCKESYCNKRELCRLTRALDPKSCYLLPEDINSVKLQMNQISEPSMCNMMVLKRDSSTLHLHADHGVRFIKNYSQIPAETELADGTYILQPFIEQYMGNGFYHRRHEVRYFVAITSTTPLRAFVYNEPIVSFSPVSYNQSKACDVESIDSSLGLNARPANAVADPNRLMTTFSEFCSHLDLSEDETDEKFREKLGRIIRQANTVISQHPVNAGITKSQAACFSFLRADMALSSTGEAYVYEYNEFPFHRSKGKFNIIQQRAYKELFTMIGLDQPPIKVDECKDFELLHLGGWVPLYR